MKLAFLFLFFLTQEKNNIHFLIRLCHVYVGPATNFVRNVKRRLFLFIFRVAYSLARYGLRNDTYFGN